MSEQLIKDIPSIKNTLDQIKAMKALKAAYPLFKPLLQSLGIATSDMEKAFAQADDLAGMAEELSELPDKFNALFGPRGWIIYDHLNIEVVRAAIAKAEAGDIDGAEQDLVESYTQEDINRKLLWMSGIRAFRPRMRLARKALEDYQEERYHACIPVTLALVDGLVNEINKGQGGFFKQGIDLTAWDSLSAHSQGLVKLAETFSKIRARDNTEPLTMPYRNGILHGMDLIYDNKMVAAKSWALLFAVRDWALKAEQGRLGPPPPQPQKSFIQVVTEYQEVQDDKKKIDAWKPRTIVVGTDIAVTGEPSVYDEGTPERALVDFLHYWKRNNYGYMAHLSAKKYEDLRKLPGKVREHYKEKKLISFELMEVNDEAAAISVISTKLIYEQDGVVREQIMGFRLLNEDTQGDPVYRGKIGSSWTILNWRLL